MKHHEFKKLWSQGAKDFILETSGSTGIPKKINLERDKLIWSAEQTLSFLPSKPGSIYIVLPTSKVGGFMQMVRAEVWKIPAHIKEPKAKVELDSDINGACISLTPLQLHSIIQSRTGQEILQKAHSILVGGGRIGFEIPEMLKAKTYHTYGMTETYSHIAYRNMDTEWFSPLPLVSLEKNEDDCLKIKCFLTDDDWLQSNDIVAFQNLGFKVLGRKDNVINTGGLKLHPEEIEAEILAENPHAFNQFFIDSEKDEVLGERVVLLKKKGLNLKLNKSSNLKYIKNIVELEKIVLTETQKIDRLLNMKKAGLMV